MRYLLERWNKIDEDKKNLLIISFFYFATHFFLLIVSGKWWDDWINYKQSATQLFEEAMELGRPTSFIPCYISMILPECGYRIITFIFFFIMAILFYKIVLKLFNIKKQDAMLMTLLYISVPVNDARIMNAVFPYTFGLLFFVIGFYQLLEILDEEKLFSFRVIINMTLFVISFSLNSLLVFYGAALLLIMVKKKKKAIYYFEYLLLPIVYYLIKSHFFSPPVGYEDYNAVTVDGLIYGVKYMAFALNAFIAAVFRKLMEHASYFVLCLIALSAILFYIKRNDQRKDKEEFKVLTILISGLIALALGLYAYIVVRMGYDVVLTGTKGRDYILCAFGFAMVLYAIIAFLFKEKFKTFIVFVFAFLGFFHFNLMYLEYQEDHYRQMSFQKQLIEHQELKNLSNIVYVSDSENENLGITRFFTLNGIASEAYGNENRLIINGLDGTWVLKNKDVLQSYTERTYKMSDYDVNKNDIDAVVEFSCDISKVNVLKLKLLELFNRQKLEETIKDYSSMKVYIGDLTEYKKSIETK